MPPRPASLTSTRSLVFTGVLLETPDGLFSFHVPSGRVIRIPDSSRAEVYRVRDLADGRLDAKSFERGVGKEGHALVRFLRDVECLKDIPAEGSMRTVDPLPQVPPEGGSARDLLRTDQSVFLGDTLIGVRSSPSGSPCGRCIRFRFLGLLEPVLPSRMTSWALPLWRGDDRVLQAARSELAHQLARIPGGYVGQWSLSEGRFEGVRPLPRPDCACGEKWPEAGSVQAVHKHFGIVGRMKSHDPDPGDPPARFLRAYGPSRVPGVGKLHASLVGDSVALGGEEKRAAAVGECLERYAGHVIPADRLLRASESRLPGPAVDVPTLLGFRKDQIGPGFPFYRYDPGASYSWIRSELLGPDEASGPWIPAQLVFLEGARSLGEPRLDERLSVGLAAGPSVESATEAALMEVLERHAVSTAWHAGRPLPDVPRSRLTDATLAGVRAWEERGVQVRFKIAPAPAQVVCVFAVLQDETGVGPYAATGMSAGYSLARCAQKAFEESMAVRRSVRRLLDDGSDPATLHSDFDRVVRLRDRAVLYASEKMAPVLNHFIRVEANPGTLPEDRDPRPSLREVCRRLRVEGYPVLRVIVTPSDLRRSGVDVVRVCVPGLRPMDIVHSAPHLLGTKDLGPYPVAPHPFA